MLINCAVYQEGKKLCDIPVEAISDYVQRSDCFVWVALRDPEPAELALMQEEFGLHELAVEDAHRGQQRPKIEEYGDSLFAVAHVLESVDGELTVGELAVFVGVNYILSVRNRSRQGFLGVRTRCERDSSRRHAALDAVDKHRNTQRIRLDRESRHGRRR